MFSFKIRYTVEIMIADQINTIYRNLELRKTVSTFKNKVAKLSKGRKKIKKKDLVTVADYLGPIPLRTCCLQQKLVKYFYLFLAEMRTVHQKCSTII